MKQVAKKSTTSLPQKLSAGNHQSNGLLRELLVPKTTANTTSSVLSEIELTNGINDSCKHMLRNDSVPSTDNHSRTSAAANTIQQQTDQHSVCTVTSASNLPVSAVTAPLTTVSQTSATSANVENSKNMKDMPVSVKHASAVTTVPLSQAASVASVNPANDVIVVKSDDADARKPDIDSVKRSISPAEEKKCGVKKARLDGAIGQSVKELDDWLVNFSNQYVKSTHTSGMFMMSKRLKELEDNQKKWEKVAHKMRRQIVDMSAKHTKIICPTLTSSSATPAVVQSKSSSNSPTKPPNALLTVAPTLPGSMCMPLTTMAPYRLPTASANLAAVQRLVPVNSLRAQVANVVMAASSASASVAVDSSRSVIDLTDDDDTNTAATKPLVQMPQQVLVFAPQHPASLPSPVTSTSTAIVRPTVRPPVPQLHMAVNQQTRLQPCVLRHPAPLPPIQPQPAVPSTAKLAPPKPTLKLSRVTNGIVLSWNMATSARHDEAAAYHLFAYQEGTDAASPNLWKRIGAVKALPLPMACTLTQFQLGNIYHFAVRAVDIHGRCGAFSEPGSIHLDP